MGTFFWLTGYLLMKTETETDVITVSKELFGNSDRDLTHAFNVSSKGSFDEIPDNLNRVADFSRLVFEIDLEISTN